MKKKNIFLMSLSLALVAVISVGATLAYMTATDDKVTNTFTFADGIEVDLYETIDNQKEDVGHAYVDVLPNTPYDKDVNVDIKTDVEAYLFIKIAPAGNGDTVALTPAQIIANGWTAYGTPADGYGEYYRKVPASTATPVAAQPFGIFEKVTIPNVELENGESSNLNDIIISVKAIQTSSFSTVAAAYAQCTYKS